MRAVQGLAPPHTPGQGFPPAGVGLDLSIAHAPLA